MRETRVLMIHETAQIHPSAIIEEGVKIGANVKVGPFSYIGADVEIGEGTEIMSHVVIKGPDDNWPRKPNFSVRVHWRRVSGSEIRW